MGASGTSPPLLAPTEKEKEMSNVYECVSCGTSFKYEDGEHKDGYLVCPSCWDEDLSIIYEDDSPDFAYLKEEG